MPCLLKVISAQLANATKSADHARSPEKALFALSEFSTNMEEHEIGPYLHQATELVVVCATSADQKRAVRGQALNALGSIITAA